MPDLSKINFEKILELAFKYPWLKPKTKALSTLLFEDCETIDQMQLVVDVLHKIEHITIADYNNYLADLALDIATINIDPQTTFVVAMSTDSTADSGQSVVYDLKLELSKVNFSGFRSVNRCDQAVRAYTDFKKTHGENRISIILVDNFVGSGSTVINRVARVLRLFRDANYPEPVIYVKVLFSTKTGRDNIISNDIDFTACHYVEDKILEKIYNIEDIEAKKQLMRDVESKLLLAYRERTLPSLGYMDSQVALSIENKNTPNNVFPIFWWKYYADNRVRDVLLYRAMDDA